MLVLGIESATPVASAALADEKGLLGEISLNVGLTHGEQLLPMIDGLLLQCRRPIDEVTAIGVSAGPGSFTGLRIGMAAAKGLALGGGIDLLAIPTLEAMAWQAMGLPILVSPMQNARRDQIYSGLYRWRKATERGPLAPAKRNKKDRAPAVGGDGLWQLDCLISPMAVAPADWSARLREIGQAVILLGDGAADYEDIWRRDLDTLALRLPPVLGLCRAAFIALAAAQKLAAGQRQDLHQIKPVYLRGF
ncbi:MAG: tRNA (adenosine(37)-N6)-threonylcarbamoyltransferase complex dimerization subunit type 1 TsaB [Peptococcaceae bacterium]|jgi:tRNA threonylcarbamoyladenosine biosynthesis protein TsaB|nr:tRNA (adenosine(37)-N6)-threonylcarbamoyltransferase complex dimerization subunit type 1 TsaB [Peptococcaceae bacterium]